MINKKELENNETTEVEKAEVETTEVVVPDEKVTLKQKVSAFVKKNGKKVGAAVGVAGAAIGGLAILAKALRGSDEETSYSGADDFGYEAPIDVEAVEVGSDE